MASIWVLEGISMKKRPMGRFFIEIPSTREFTVAIRPVVVGRPQVAAIGRNGAPRLPLRRVVEARGRSDVIAVAPGCATVGRVGVEDVVVAGRGGGRGVALAVWTGVTEIG